MTIVKMLPTLARVNSLLEYDPATGEFRWRISTSNRVRVGQLAGTLDTNGYRRIKIDGRRYLAHRLAWLITHQVWPTDQIDHMDGNPDNNRIANLREATYVENGQNRKPQTNNSSGHPGVCFKTQSGKHRARIQVDHREVHLGYFDTLEEAITARQAAEIKHFGEFRCILTSRKANLPFAPISATETELGSNSL